MDGRTGQQRRGLRLSNCAKCESDKAGQLDKRTRSDAEGHAAFPISIPWMNTWASCSRM